MKKFWKWVNQTPKNLTTPETQENQEQSQISDRTLYLNGQIAEVSWFDDDVTPQLFKDELMSGEGNITVWINSPGGDCVAAAQIYNMLKEYSGDVVIKIGGFGCLSHCNGRRQSDYESGRNDDDPQSCHANLG